jgi:malonyl CoA-acyl carrier protein transacylase
LKVAVADLAIVVDIGFEVVSPSSIVVEENESTSEAARMTRAVVGVQVVLIVGLVATEAADRHREITRWLRCSPT